MGVIASRTVRVTRSGGVVSATTLEASGQATELTLVGDGQPVLTAICRHVASGVVAAATVSVVQGGSQGSAGSDGDPGTVGGFLPNWNFTQTDAATGKPWGIKPVEGISDTSQLQFGGIGIQILGSPDASVAYGFPAIPISDKLKYKLIIRHKSSAAGASGLYLRCAELNTQLAAGDTHVGAASSPPSGCTARTSYKDLVTDGAMPGTTTAVNEYTYTPTAGARFMSFSMYNWTGFTGIYEVESVQLVPYDFVDGAISQSTQISDGIITTDLLAATLTFTKELVLSTSGKIRQGKTSPGSTTAGLWIGHDGASSYDVHVGDANGYFRWDGSATALQVLGQVQFAQIQTFTPGWTGFGTNPSGTVSYLDLGDIVVIFFPADRTGETNAATFTMSGIPAAIQPAQQAFCDFVALDGGLQRWAKARINTDGTATMYLGIPSGSNIEHASNNWTSSSAASPDKGILAGSIFIYPK